MNDRMRLQGVSVIPINTQGKILLQQRDDRPDLVFPGCWTTFGGSVEAGETPEEAMHRELLEEIELDLPVKLWKTIEFTIERDGQVLKGDGYIYVAPIEKAEDEIVLHEGQALGYFALADLTKLKIGFGFESVFREIFAALADGSLKIER